MFVISIILFFLFEITIIQIKKATNKTDNEIFTKIQ